MASDQDRDPVSHGPSVPSTSIFLPDIFKGKVLFCTGGGTGICRGIVKSIMAHGASAAIVGRRQEVLEKTAKELKDETGGECIATPADVRKFEQLEEAVKKTVDRFGRIDFVICGAAGNFLSLIDGLSPNAFRTVMEIDVMGTYNTIKATGPHVKASHGAYLSISATLHYKANLLQTHVGAAKAGVDHISQNVALEWGPHGVRSNVIAPGPIEGTEGVARLIPKDAQEMVVRATPVQRWGAIDDIANAAVFLFSPAASYITGTVLVVDGGEYHSSGIGKMMPYPEITLMGGDMRSILKAML